MQVNEDNHYICTQIQDMNHKVRYKCTALHRYSLNPDMALLLRFFEGFQGMSDDSYM